MLNISSQFGKLKEKLIGKKKKPMIFEVGAGITPAMVPKGEIKAEEKIKTVAEGGKGLPSKTFSPTRAWQIKSELELKKYKGQQLTLAEKEAYQEATRVSEEYMVGAVIGSVTPMKTVSPKEAEILIAKSTNLTRADLQQITSGGIVNKVKLEAYKTLTKYPELKERLSVIAQNKKISLTSKITNYIKDLLPKEIPVTKKVPTQTLVAEKGIISKELQPLTQEVKPIRTPIPPSPPVKDLPQMAGKPIEDPIKKLNDLLKEAKPLRGKLERAYTAERAKRISEVERVIDEVGGEKGYAIALSKLKGELVSKEAKVAFEPVKEKLSKESVDALYNLTFKHPYLDNWEKVNSAEALTKLFTGQLPTEKQLVLLEEVYGTDLIKNLLAKRAMGLKVTDIIMELANVPRAMLATADMSAFLRQGIIEVAAHPIISVKAMGKTFQFAFSQKAFEQYFKDLPKDKLYPLMRKSGLSITDPSRALASGREEAFISRFLQKVPILGQAVKFAERSYVGFLNKLRVDVFKNWSNELLSKGFSPVKDADTFKAVADVVNNFTGRGNLGTLNRITPQLNVVFFSPRLIAARFNALNPIWYAQMPKEIRMKAISDFAKFVGVGLTILAVAKLSGEVDVEADPRSSDFGKMRIGNTRYDIWGGFQQWARVFAQLITGERKNTETGEIVSLTKDEYPFTTRKEVLLTFIEGKLAPVPALINELMSGAKTFSGEEMTFETVAKEKFIPMYIQDIADAYEDGGLGRSTGAGISAFFGVGVQTWQPKQTKTPIPTMGLPIMPGILPKMNLPPMPGMNLQKMSMPGIK